MYEITMPKLSDSMEEGKIIEWKVQEGDEVHEGDTLAEIESDKAAMELECFHDGVLAKILRGDDQEAPVGAVIGYIAAEGEEVPQEEEAEKPQAEEQPPEEKEAEAQPPPEEEAKEEAAAEEEEEKPPPRPAPAPGERPAASPYARKLAEETGVDLAQVEGSGPGGRIIARDVEAAAEGKPKREAEKPKPKAAEKKPRAEAKAVDAEPMARALAEKYDIELARLAGTGLAGRVTVDDVLAAREETEPTPQPEPSADEELPPLEVSDEEADVEDAPFRLKTLARRVVASKHVIPHFYLTRGADVTRLLGRKDELKHKHGATITHLVMLACLKALGEHPGLNRSYDRGKVFTWKGIHLGLAVDTPAGLTVAVLRDAQDLSLAAIAERTGKLVEKARGRGLSAEERRHPTFTISNLGMFGVEHFQPIINPPSAVTLAVASALPRPIADGEAIRVGTVMGLTMSCDHRIVDGAGAARFLADLRALLEEPDRLLEGQ